MTPDELMLAAKNKYDSMVEKGTWNAPTAEEKIVALEAKLETTVKNLNKKVSFELGKKTSGKKTSDRFKNKKANKKSIGHPKTWSQPKPGDKKEAEYKGYTWYWCGKKQVVNVRNGGLTNQKTVTEGCERRATNARLPNLPAPTKEAIKRKS